MVGGFSYSTRLPIKRFRPSTREPRWRSTTDPPSSSLASSEVKHEPVLCESARNSRRCQPTLPAVRLSDSARFPGGVTKDRRLHHYRGVRYAKVFLWKLYFSERRAPYMYE